jgi:hypothetical protein
VEVILMTLSQTPHDEDRTSSEPGTERSHKGPRWWWTVLGIAALIVAGVILYFALYGGSSSVPSSGGGYAVLALSADRFRRIRNRSGIRR